jgi:hypothetical protein
LPTSRASRSRRQFRRRCGRHCRHQSRRRQSRSWQHRHRDQSPSFGTIHFRPTINTPSSCFLNSGVDLQDGSVAAIGYQIALPVAQARALVERGSAEYVPEKASG